MHRSLRSPPAASAPVETLTIEDQRLTLVVQVTVPTAVCPTCAPPATCRHSAYRRTLADLP